MRRIAVAAVLVAAVAAFGEEPQQQQQAQPNAQVTLGLDQYESLLRGTERPSASVVDTLLLTGNFGARSLSIAFTGRSVGARPVVRTFEGANDVTISNCSGDAILMRTAKGAFSIVPLKDAFVLTCSLYVSGGDRLRMHVLPGVLAVRSSVSDGELISGDESDDGARDYSLVRHVGGPGEALPATATGRYLVTLLPDATRFRYTIEVHNPNRTPSPIDVVLASNEHLQQIDSGAPYDVNGNSYRFVIPPGDSTISMNGELRGTSFAAPVRASLQYLVIESHPLLRPRVETPAKRISVGETGITPQYRGAIAFETNTERIGWTVTRLEALHTISYAVNNIAHTLFVPVDGPVLGESAFRIHNEGAPELLLPPKPEPTYVALQNEPVLMTKDRSGRVSVPLMAGDQEVVAQHRQPFRRKLGFGFGTVAVPSLDVPATQTSVRLSYPEEWRPLFESFATEARVWLPSTGDVLMLVLLALWFERVLSWIGLALKRRIVIAIVLAIAASLISSFLWIAVLVFGALTVLWIVVLAKSGALTVARGLLSAVAIVVILIILAIPTINRTASNVGSGSYKEESAVVTDTAAATDTSATDIALGSEPRRVGGKVDRAQQVSNYQGLPAKFTLPNGVRSTHFSQELLRADRPQTVFMLVISTTLVKWLGALFALAGIFLVWRQRAAIVGGLRARIAAVTDVPEPAAAA